MDKILIVLSVVLCCVGNKVSDESESNEGSTLVSKMQCFENGSD